MAAMKIQSPVTAASSVAAPVAPQPQLHSPVLSTASSITNDSSAATHHPSSPDVSSTGATSSNAATPVNSAPETNHNSPTTPLVSHDYDSGFSMDSKTISPENDSKSSGSVIEKASLFERLEIKKSASPTVASQGSGMCPLNRSESLYGRRNEEIYRACGTLDSGELDGFDLWGAFQDHRSLVGEFECNQQLQPRFRVISLNEFYRRSKQSFA